MSETNPPEAPVQPTPAPDDAPRPVKQTERPHPLTPLIRGWVVLLAIVVGFGREFIPDGSGEEPGIVGLGLRWILLGILAIVVLAAAAGFASWYFTRYVIDDEELRIETGAVFKNSKRVPVRAGPVGRHHPAVRGPDLRSGRASARGRCRRLHHQAALSHPSAGVVAARLPAQPGPTATGRGSASPTSGRRAGSPTSPPRTRPWSTGPAATDRGLPAVERVPVLGRAPGRRPDRLGGVRRWRSPWPR